MYYRSGNCSYLHARAPTGRGVVNPLGHFGGRLVRAGRGVAFGRWRDEHGRARAPQSDEVVQLVVPVALHVLEKHGTREARRDAQGPVGVAVALLRRAEHQEARDKIWLGPFKTREPGCLLHRGNILVEA